jgi:hypothetical protein
MIKIQRIAKGRGIPLYKGYYNNNNKYNSVLYFNVLTRQLQRPITESAQTHRNKNKLK